jgi:hypothetical protein
VVGAGGMVNMLQALTRGNYSNEIDKKACSMRWMTGWGWVGLCKRGVGHLVSKDGMGGWNTTPLGFSEKPRTRSHDEPFASYAVHHFPKFVRRRLTSQ